MWISEFRVQGFKAFADTGNLVVKSGLNLIIGQNNSGKSSLIQALAHGFAGTSHKSPREYRNYALPKPKVRIVLHCHGAELRSALLSALVNRQFFNMHFKDDYSDQRFLESLESLEEFNVVIEREASGNFGVVGDNALPFIGRNNQGHTVKVISQNGSLRFTGIYGGEQHNFDEIFDHIWLEKTFHFGAQRYSIGSYPFSREDRLHPNAANLPAVLAALQGDRGDLYGKLINHLVEIFDNIGNLSIATTGGGFQVRTWPTSEMVAPDLSFSLDDSGTGVSQVIAILLVAMTMQKAIITIDEISSFLHPAAAKSLLRILQTNYAEHQYIVTTHSPEVISSSIVESVKLVRRNGYVSSVDEIDLKKVSDLKEVCSHIGVTMSDVFAANRVIWVEGQTEELIFPYIYGNCIGSVPKGTLVTAVVATGDFTSRRKRDREMAFAVYERLTEAATPLIDASIFSFDQEGLSADDMAQLQERSSRRILFLPRRNLEAYLLNTDALHFSINDLIDNTDHHVSHQGIIDWLLANGGHQSYNASTQWTGSLDDSLWLDKVDGARLIKNLFSNVTEGRVEFSKTRDDIKIVRYLLEGESPFLAPLIEFVRELYERLQ